MAKQQSSQNHKMSDQDILDLLEKTGKQYQVYLELQNVANLAQQPAEVPHFVPSSDRPLTTTLLDRK